MKKVIFIIIVILATTLLAGCLTATMPDLQGIPSTVKYVETYRQSATMLIMFSGPLAPSTAHAIVPQIELTNQDRLAIYRIDDNTLSIVINGRDRTIDAKLYHLGIAGISMAEGWDWRHNLAELERQMEEDKQQ